MRGIAPDTFSNYFDLDVINECTITLIGPPNVTGTRYRFVHPDLGRILDVIFTGRSQGYLDFGTEFYWLPPRSGGNSGGSPRGGTPAGTKTGTDPQGRPLKPPEELLSSDPKTASKDPEETLRLYQLIRQPKPRESAPRQAS